MNARTLLILAVLVLALFAVRVYQDRSHELKTSTSDTIAVLDAAFTNTDVNRIVIGFGADSTAIDLERLPESWVARSAYDHTVDEARVNSLLNELNGLRGEFRSDTGDVLADYGLGLDNNKIRVTLYGTEWENIFDLDIGEKSEGGTGNFIKRPGQDAVFLTRSNLLGQMGLYSGPELPHPRHFLELEVFKCDREAIASISIHDGESSLGMEKIYSAPEAIVADDGTTTQGEIDYSIWEWALVEPEPQPLAKTKVDAIANALASVRAKDVDDPMVNLDTYGLWRAERRISVVMRDGSEVELRFGSQIQSGDESPTGQWLMTSQDRTIWILDTWKADQLFKTLEDLKPDLPEATEETS